MMKTGRPSGWSNDDPTGLWAGIDDPCNAPEEWYVGGDMEELLCQTLADELWDSVPWIFQ